MVDFLNRLKEYIESLTYTPSTVGIGLYNENQDSVAIRPTPSNINERYMESDKIYTFSFQLMVHHNDNMQAYETINKLYSELDNLPSGAITSSNGSFNLVIFKCTTTPNHVQKTSYGTLWTAMFEADLYIKGGQ